MGEPGKENTRNSYPAKTCQFRIKQIPLRFTMKSWHRQRAPRHRRGRTSGLLPRGTRNRFWARFSSATRLTRPPLTIPPVPNHSRSPAAFSSHFTNVSLTFTATLEAAAWHKDVDLQAVPHAAGAPFPSPLQTRHHAGLLRPHHFFCLPLCAYWKTFGNHLTRCAGQRRLAPKGQTKPATKGVALRRGVLKVGVPCPPSITSVSIPSQSSPAWLRALLSRVHLGPHGPASAPGQSSMPGAVAAHAGPPCCCWLGKWDGPGCQALPWWTPMGMSWPCSTPNLAGKYPAAPINFTRSHQKDRHTASPSAH